MKSQKTTLNILCTSIGIVFLWFGALKFFVDLSPAETIAQDTISVLTMGALSPTLSIQMLATGEVLIGLLLVLGIQRKRIALIAMMHLACTFSAVLFFPDRVFGSSIFAFTLLGQYIFKNVVLIASLLLVYTQTNQQSIPSISMQPA